MPERAIDPHDHCLGCGTEFGYVTEDDPVVLCRACDQVMHTDCFGRHECPETVAGDREKLAAWRKAVEGA